MRLSHLGDVVLALPLFHALRERFPEARIAWVCQPEFKGLLRGLPGLERVFLFGRRDGARAWWRLRRELRAFAPDLAVDLQANLKSATATRLSGAPRRFGLHPSDWREPVAGLALTEWAEPLGPGPVHAMERTHHLAQALTALVPDTLRRDPGLRPRELAEGERLAAEHLAGGAEPVVLLPGVEGDPRSWPGAHLETLARLLRAEGRGVSIVTGPGEAALGERLARALGSEPGLRHWVGQRGPRSLAAFFTAAASRGAVAVAGDSGPMHLAAACGLPVRLLAGPTDARRTGPWPVPLEDRGGAPSGDPASPHAVLRAREPLACAPCLARRCTHPAGVLCQTRLEPALVARSLQEDALGVGSA